MLTITSGWVKRRDRLIAQNSPRFLYLYWPTLVTNSSDLVTLKVYIILLILVASISGHSQEIPPIQNYHPHEYAAGNQNWSIAQSESGWMYFANTAGLLEYNGATWTLYPSPNGSVMRSVAAIDNRIYTGCYMEFGYWERDEFGRLFYTSLIDKVAVELIEDEQFWNIREFEDRILFQSLDRIYIYNTLDGSFETIQAQTTRSGMFITDGDIIYQTVDQGLFKIEKGKAVLISDAPIFREKIIVGTVIRNYELIAITNEGDLVHVTDEGVQVKGNEAEFLAGNTIYSSLQLQDDTYILGTISNGIVQLNENAEVIRTINQERGLVNNTVLVLFEDQDGHLWLGTDNGISLINLKSAFREFNDKIGRLGVVYASVQFKDHLYLGTNQGLFYKSMKSVNEFKFVSDTQGQVWCLKVIDDTLFCGHNAGTFIIEEGRAKRISEYPGTWDLKLIDGIPEMIIQGNYSGLTILEKKDGDWRFRNRLEGFDISSRFFEFLSPHRIITIHEQKGIYWLAIDSDYHKIRVEQSKNRKGEGSSLVSFQSELLYASNQGVFKINKDTGSLQRDSLLSRLLFPKDDAVIGILTSDNSSERLWGFSESNIIYVAPDKIGGEPKATKIPIHSTFRRSMGVFGFEALSSLGEDKYLIGRSDGYTMLDLRNSESDNRHTIRINSISRASHEEGNLPVLMGDYSMLDFKENNLSFHYSVAAYDKYKEVNYQYKLEGFYDNWSNWSSQPEVSFKNLPYGEYTFRVRSRIGDDFSTNTATHEFLIRKPWYLSNPVILIYILISVTAALFTHSLYRRYYAKQKLKIEQENEQKIKRRKLKSQKKIMQLRNEQLQAEIDSKNRELAASTLSIIRKNEFLNRLKSELRERANDPLIKKVMRTIDQNISTEEDWKFFEEAFNNADKDFLQKVKGLHQNLTPNDLRLCAYLRLNLSSKEIAPLLNISVRSVEVKRYRLRKKIDLPHERSLTDYILQL